MTGSGSSSITDLDRAGSELSEVTRLVSALERESEPGRTVRFGLSGNVTIDLLGPFLRKQALLHGLRAAVAVGTFDDPLGNARQFAADKVDAVILLDLADSLMPAFEARIPTMEPAVLDSAIERFGQQLALTLEATRAIPHVFVGLVHRLTPPPVGSPDDDVDRVIARLNDAIENESSRFANVVRLDTGAIAARLGWERAHDWRSYERFHAPFTPAFLDELALAVYRTTRGFGSRYYKVLVVDGDNTLWGGILGEDLQAGLKLGPHGYPGSIYWRVQQSLLALQRGGVLLCLCSKNNAADVDALLATHPEMILRDEHFAAKAVNWNDKPTNLIRLSEQLNIGLDAFVFLDDSSFECEAVRNQLPMVRTIQVPASLFEYPDVVADLADLFRVADISGESASKTEQYRLVARAADERDRHATEAEFLASLGLTVTIGRNDPKTVARVAELTQKSNQFNLTTRRYTEAQIGELIASDDSDVFTVHVSDKFGDSGLTGVIITRYQGATAAIDTFLLSCRVLGRGVETSIWRMPLETARERGSGSLAADFLPTAKNGQVRDFWDRLGLELISEDPGGRRHYAGDLATFSVQPEPHIEVHHAA